MSDKPGTVSSSPPTYSWWVSFTEKVADLASFASAPTHYLNQKIDGKKNEFWVELLRLSPRVLIHLHQAIESKAPDAEIAAKVSSIFAEYLRSTSAPEQKSSSEKEETTDEAGKDFHDMRSNSTNGVSKTPPNGTPSESNSADFYSELVKACQLSEDEKGEINVFIQKLAENNGSTLQAKLKDLDDHIVNLIGKKSGYSNKR